MPGPVRPYSRTSSKNVLSSPLAFRCWYRKDSACSSNFWNHSSHETMLELVLAGAARKVDAQDASRVAIFGASDRCRRAAVGLDPRADLVVISGSCAF
jgi:hypothetical protein